MEDGSLGFRFWLKVGGIVLACAAGAVIVFLILGAAWLRWGLFGAILFFGALLLLYAWIYDRRHARPYDDTVV